MASTKLTQSDALGSLYSSVSSPSSFKLSSLLKLTFKKLLSFHSGGPTLLNSGYWHKWNNRK